MKCHRLISSIRTTIQLCSSMIYIDCFSSFSPSAYGFARAAEPQNNRQPSERALRERNEAIYHFAFGFTCFCWVAVFVCFVFIPFIPFCWRLQCCTVLFPSPSLLLLTSQPLAFTVHIVLFSSPTLSHSPLRRTSLCCSFLSLWRIWVSIAENAISFTSLRHSSSYMADAFFSSHFFFVFILCTLFVPGYLHFPPSVEHTLRSLFLMLAHYWSIFFAFHCRCCCCSYFVWIP